MDELGPRLERLGREIASADDSDPRALDHARRRLRESGRATPKRPSPLMLFGGVAAAAVAVALIGWLATQPGEQSEALTYQVAGAAPSGEWIGAVDEVVPVRFSDGTSLEMEPGASARIASLGRSGADVSIERGTVRARVRHRAETSWIFHAGPYAVRVTGTEFVLRWDGAAGELIVVMEEGSVVVERPEMDPVALGAGQELTINGDETRVRTVGEGSASLATAETEPVEDADEPVGHAAASDTARPPARRSAPDLARPEADPAREAQPEVPRSVAQWRRRLAERDHDGAMAAAERAGFGSVLQQASVAELYQLADSARLAGRVERSEQVLRFLRDQRRERGRTAFMLGRLAGARSGDQGRAADWFRTYLEESPRGPLAEPALGRLLQIERSRSPGEARGLATRYLERFPAGAHVSAAREILNTQP